MSHVHIGNVAEFNEQFGVADTEEQRRDVRRSCDVYAAITPFLTDEPGTVILPCGVGDDRWWDHLRERLAWDDLQPVVVEVAPDWSLCDVIAMSHDLRSLVLRGGAGSRIVPWGESPSYRDLVAGVPADRATRSIDPAAGRHAESKVGCREIFVAARSGQHQVGIPRSIVCHGVDDLAAAVRDLGADGRSIIVKAAFGVSGYGTHVLGPDWAGALAGNGAAIAEHLASVSSRFEQWPLVVQEQLVRPRAAIPDLTGDAEVMPDGRVEYRGGAAMLVDLNHYGGAATACATLATAQEWATIEGFTVDVGHELSRSGYRGWYDVDYFRSVDGSLAALEINARRTGPVVAFTVAERLRRRGEGSPVAVASRDSVPLPVRLDASTVFDELSRIEAVIDGTCLATAFLALEDDAPAIGLSGIGSDGVTAIRVLDAAIDELMVRLLAVADVERPRLIDRRA